MVILGLILFLIAQIGYSSTLRQFSFNKYGAWILGMLLQILILYFFAMVNLLNFALKGIVFLGICLVLVELVLTVTHHNQIKFEGLHYFDVWMLSIGIILGRVLWHSPLIHYDNYSHWALIAKFLLFSGHLPTAADSLISFTAYPPATALFITAFSKWVGFSDGALLVGQFLLIWASLYALFAVLRDRTRALNGFILCFAIAVINIFNIAIRMNNLLVDFVLPVVTAAAIATIYAERAQIYRQYFSGSVFMSVLLLTKNSGTMYVIMIACYLGYLTITQPRGQRLRQKLAHFLATLLSLGLSYLPFLWWSWHVKTTFTKVAKHQISRQAYQQQLSHESRSVILKIVHQFCQQVFSLDSLSTQGVILINLLLLISWLIIRIIIHQKNNLGQVLLALDLSFILYYFSVLAMYLVSMPYAEAIKLDGSERYLASMVVLNLLLAVMALVVAIDHAFHEQNISRRDLRSFHSIITKNIYQITALGLMIFSVILMFSEINGIEYNNTLGQEQLPVQLKKIAPQQTKLNHHKILLVDPHLTDVDNYYAGYVGRYYFFTDQVVGQENFMMSPARFKQTLQTYQYVALPEWHRTFTVMLDKTYHQQYRTGFFKVTPTGLVKVSPN
ncbi:glycosyltransferase family 39 protein [Lapidilactobacillus wuchangensis]|uniref:glycosyltransferase family 39 protein n=1 Tax=Lapidilactobacillus wuchangensis TaxID=2486001 RepID=UPI000F77DD96|nr:glycosyltransferase family 39 protein [Lapidilactobacillus wuchangensis]